MDKFWWPLGLHSPLSSVTHLGGSRKGYRCTYPCSREKLFRILFIPMWKWSRFEVWKEMGTAAGLLVFFFFWLNSKRFPRVRSGSSHSCWSWKISFFLCLLFLKHNLGFWTFTEKLQEARKLGAVETGGETGRPCLHSSCSGKAILAVK